MDKRKAGRPATHKLSLNVDSDIWAMLTAVSEHRRQRPGIAWRMTTVTRVVSDAVELLYRHEIEGEDIVRERSMPDRG